MDRLLHFYTSTETTHMKEHFLDLTFRDEYCYYLQHRHWLIMNQNAHFPHQLPCLHL